MIELKIRLYVLTMGIGAYTLGFIQALQLNPWWAVAVFIVVYAAIHFFNYEYSLLDKKD